MKTACLPLLLLLSACQPLNALLGLEDPVQKLEQEILLERKKQELERLRQQAQASPMPTPTGRPALDLPVSFNRQPRIDRLSSQLISTRQPRDTVQLRASASDPDGDALEYQWTSVYPGLSATKGEAVVWYPGEQDLRGRTNIITLSVSDKKGGSSTGSLNIAVQSDGSLLVRENLAAQPVLSALNVSREGSQLTFQAQAQDPGGGELRYRWQSNRGILSSSSTARTVWSPGPDPGDVVVSLELSNLDGSARSHTEFHFYQQSDGTLLGDFRNFQGPTLSQLAPSPPPKGAESLPDQHVLSVGGPEPGDLLTRTHLRTGQRTVLLRSTDLIGAVSKIGELAYDGQDTVYLRVKGSGQQLYAFSLASREIQPLSFSPPTATAWNLLGLKIQQGQPYVLYADLSQPEPRHFLSSLDGRRLWPLDQALAVTGQLSAGGLLAYYNALQNSVTVLQPASRSSTDLLSTGSHYFGKTVPLAWDSTGERLAVLVEGKLWLLNLRGEKRELPLENPVPLTQVLWSLDDRYLLLAGEVPRGKSKAPLYALPVPEGRRLLPLPVELAGNTFSLEPWIALP